MISLNKSLNEITVKPTRKGFLSTLIFVTMVPYTIYFETMAHSDVTM